MDHVRIVHANKAYWPHLGGVETVVRDLAESDPRITPVGRWLRRTPMDELPQAWV